MFGLTSVWMSTSIVDLYTLWGEVTSQYSVVALLSLCCGATQRVTSVQVES